MIPRQISKNKFWHFFKNVVHKITQICLWFYIVGWVEDLAILAVLSKPGHLKDFTNTGTSFRIFTPQRLKFWGKYNFYSTVWLLEENKGRALTSRAASTRDVRVYLIYFFFRKKIIFFWYCKMFCYNRYIENYTHMLF